MEVDKRRLVPETGYYRNLDEGRKPETTKEEKEKP